MGHERKTAGHLAATIRYATEAGPAEAALAVAVTQSSAAVYTKGVKIALGQINPTIGDFSGNSAKIIECSRQAHSLGAEMALFPELAVCGYPPRDLLEKPAFVP